MQKKDYPGITLITCQIKGASALLGVFDLMELADKIYQNAKLKIDTDYQELIDIIEQIFDFLDEI